MKPFTPGLLLLFAACAPAPLPPAQQAPDPVEGSAEAVRFVTTDIPHFWRAYDAAAGADSAARVRAFHDLYLVPASAGLRDWILLRLADQRRVLSAIDSAGRSRDWARTAMNSPRGSALRDSLDQIVLPAARRSAAENLARVTARFPRYYAGVRPQTLALDTSSVLRTTVQSGLRRLAELVPGARFSHVYFVIGRLNSGGTTGESGMLIGAELSARTPETPMDELPPDLQVLTSALTAQQLAHLVVHETVHMLQAPLRDTTLLGAALREGSADFLATLATGLRPEWTVYQRHGSANEAAVWRAFAAEMHDSDRSEWLYNYGSRQQHGAPDLGYWVGYRIAESYYARATDKQAAVRELLTAADPARILALSGYGPE
jgi:hypothetical protein